MKNVILFLLGSYLISSSVFANSGIKFLKKAEESFRSHQYSLAIDYYKKALPDVKSKAAKAEILFKTAECYMLINDPKQAEIYFQKCIKAGHPDPMALLYSAQCRMKLGNYAAALDDFKKFKWAVPSDPAGELGEKSCTLALQWMNEPTSERVENVQQINSKDWDYAPSYDGKKYNGLYFTSTRMGVTGDGTVDNTHGGQFADLFFTRIDNAGKWSTPTPLPSPLNSSVNDAAGMLTRKGTAMYFTKCGKQSGKDIKCQIMVSQKQGNSWQDPTSLLFNVDSFNFGHPCLNISETVIVFSSDMLGGFGGLDLWVSTLDKKNKSWSAPRNLGASVNSAGDEMYPFLHDDGSLYYSSNGFPGMGGLDIFRSSSTGSNNWSNPENLKYPMNSSADDFGIIFEGNKRKGYFTSGRAGGKGGDDIYSFYIEPIICTLEGYVYDEIQLKSGIKVPVPGALVKLHSSDGNVSEIRTDITGYYKFENLAAENGFVVSTKGIDRVWKDSKDVYLGFDNGKLSTHGIKKSTLFKKDLDLLKEEPVMRLPAVLYNVDESTLDHVSNPKDSLEYLYKTLMENPSLVIELASHTDYRDSHQHNDTLSYNRAKAVVDYMISRGIDARRMRARGYGERKPLKISVSLTLPSGKVLSPGTVLTESFIKSFKAKSPDFEYLNQLNRRTEFSVLGKDFKGQSGQGEPEDIIPDIQLKIDKDLRDN